MLRAAAIASLPLRRLVLASTTAPPPASQPSLLLGFISAPAASPVRRLLPALTRGYAWGHSYTDEDDDEYEAEANYYDSDRDGMEMDDGSDDNCNWDDAEVVADHSD